MQGFSALATAATLAMCLVGGKPGLLPLQDARPRVTNLVVMAQQKAVFPRDPGLAARMLLTMFLLGLLYVVFIVRAARRRARA